jgi:ABC-type Fe3+ transport system permease subunit
LDLLKKDRKKNENSFEQKSEMDIYKMIHKRSSSIVKWILIISVVEFILWNIINFGFTGEAYIKRNFSAEVYDYILEMNTILSITCLIILSVFVYIFYKNYKNINAATSTKQLMKDILRTRKTVKYYVWTNILLFIVGNFTVLFIRLNYENKFIKLGEKLNHDSGMLIKSLGITICVIAIVAFLIWLFYRLIYGILLKKLNHNYKELKKMDN